MVQSSSFLAIDVDGGPLFFFLFLLRDFGNRHHQPIEHSRLEFLVLLDNQAFCSLRSLTRQTQHNVMQLPFYPTFEGFSPVQQ
jgi:hypothetical protein